jgi:hypothetical protein
MTSIVQTLAELIDPQAWQAQKKGQTTVGSWWEFRERRQQSIEAAERVAAWLEKQK